MKTIYIKNNIYKLSVLFLINILSFNLYAQDVSSYKDSTSFHNTISDTSIVIAKSSSDTTYLFDLTDCLNFAFENKVDYQNAKIDEEIAKSKVREYWGMGLPQVTAQVSVQHYFDMPTVNMPNYEYVVYKVLRDNNITGPGGTPIAPPPGMPTSYQMTLEQPNNITAGLEVTQLIFDGAYFSGLKAAKVYSELANKQVNRSKIDTRVSVSKAYFNVIVNNSYLNTIEATICRLESTFQETEVLVNNGLAEKIDLERIRVMLNNSQTKQKTAQRVADMSITLLKYQIGMPVSAKLELKETLNDLKLDAILPELLNFSIENRIEYDLLKTQQRIAELNIKRHKNAFLPSISAMGSFQYFAQNNSFNDVLSPFMPVNYVGVGMKVPLYLGGQRKQKVKQSELELRKINNDLRKMENGLNMELKTATTIFLNNKDEVENQVRNLELAKEVSRVTKIKYSEGIGSSLEVTTAENELKTAENEYYSAVHTAILSWIEVQKALGQFSENN